MRKGIIISLAVILLVFLAIGCTDTGTNETEVVPPAENETTDTTNITDQQAVEEEQPVSDVVETTEVEVNEDGFTPETIRVMVGDTVTWTNTGEEDQTVASDDDLFASGILRPGEIFTYTFEEAGTYDYSSEENLLASGTVIVETGEAGQQAGNQTDNLTTVPVTTTTNVTAEDRGYETTPSGDIIVESDQPTTNITITPDEEEDNNTTF